jgi:hypothetical protein
MRKIQSLTLIATLGVSLLAAPSTQAKAKVTKPSDPTVVSVTSSTPKNGKVNVTVKISLPKKNGGSKITGSKVTAGGKSCTMKKLKTSCTIKGIKTGTSLSVKASSKNSKGFGANSKTVKYVAGKGNYPKVTKPSAPTIVSIKSSVPKKGKVNVTVKISLPKKNGGSKITGSKVTAGGKSCTMKKLKTSCTIKGIKTGTSLSVKANSKNAKGYGASSKSVRYVAGKGKYPTASPSRLKFNTKNAVGIALTAPRQNLRGFRNAVSSSSNLVVTDASGKVSDAISSGTASVSNFMIAPNGDIFVVFQSPTKLVEGGSDCLLALVDKASGLPTCIDDSLQSISWNVSDGNNPPIQFDSAGAIYYSGDSTSGKTVLRMYKNGKSKDLINDNISVGMFMVVPTGGVIVSGTTTSTGTSWVRRINSSGGLRTFESTGSSGISTYADGNIYYGVWGPSDFGIKRYLISSDSLDSQYWISGNINGVERQSRNNVSELCSGADDTVNRSFCGWYGTVYSSVHSPIGGKTFIVAGSSGENRTLTQVYPSLAAPQISIKKISLALTLGGGIAITGLNAANQNALIYYNTDSGKETLLLPPKNEIEIYHMVYNASTNKIMFDGLRFSDNKYVFGQVDLGTTQVNIFSTLSAKWEDFQGFQ